MASVDVLIRLASSRAQGRPRARRRDRDELAASLPDIARALARGISAGLPLDLAIDRASEAVPDVAAALLAASARAIAAGTPPAEALAPLAAVPGGAIVVGAIALNAELGGDLVAALGALADGLADRERLRGELAAATAQARLATRLVPALPVGAVLLVGLLNPVSLRLLVTTPVGVALVLASVTMTSTALLLIRRIMRSAAP